MQADSSRLHPYHPSGRMLCRLATPAPVFNRQLQGNDLRNGADFYLSAVEWSANQMTSFTSPEKPLYCVRLTGWMVAPCHLWISEWPSAKVNPQAPLW